MCYWCARDFGEEDVEEELKEDPRKLREQADLNRRGRKVWVLTGVAPRLWVKRGGLRMEVPPQGERPQMQQEGIVCIESSTKSRKRGGVGYGPIEVLRQGKWQ